MLLKYLIKNETKINPNVRKLIFKFGEEDYFLTIFEKYNKLKSVTNIPTIDLIECFYREIKTPIIGTCQTCGKSTKFGGWAIGWNKFCNASCQMGNASQQALREEMSMALYGTKCFLNSQASLEKISITKSSEEYKKKFKAICAASWTKNRREIIDKMLSSRKRNGSKYWTARFPKILPQLEIQGFTVISTLESGKPKSIKHLSCGTEQAYKRWINGAYSCEACNPNPRIKSESVVLNEIEKVLNVQIQRNIKIGNIKVDGLIDNLAIDFNGLFWHSQAAENAGFGKFDPLYHFKRYGIAKKHNIKLIQIFEDEWKFNREEILVMLGNMVKGEFLESFSVTLIDDNLWPNWDVLDALGYRITGKIDPTYEYYDKKNFRRISKEQLSAEMQVAKEWDRSLSEIENAQKFGCFQVFNAGKTEWSKV